MDLVAGVQRVVVLMDHVAKDGSHKLLKECDLPLTGRRCVDRVITDLGIFDIIDRKMQLVELAPEVTVDEVKSKTTAEFIIHEAIAA